LEALEARRLLNASIDIAADGSLVFRSGSVFGQTVEVRREDDLYTIQSPTPIDVASHDSGLTVTGSGTMLVTVTGPSSLRLVAESNDQGVVVRSTGVPTAIDLQANRTTIFLGDDGTEGSGGLAALSGPITIAAAAGTNSNRLSVSDGDHSYDPSGVLTYIVSATPQREEGKFRIIDEENHCDSIGI
jgi:hypothetical protein